VKGRLLWARLDPGGLAGDGAEAVVPWWSVTKTVMAAAVLRLVGTGGLDAPQPEGFTLRALLQHRAGLPDYGGLAAYHAAVAAGGPPWDEAELLARVGGPAGRPWLYSNVGYLFVRRALERLGGGPLEVVLREAVLAPLAAGTVRLAQAPEDLAACALPPPRGYDPGWAYHGCLIGPVGEAARVMAEVLGGDLLPAAARAAMAEPFPVGGALPGRPWRRASYGLGLMVGTMAAPGGPPFAVAGHGAGGPGSAGCVFRYPGLPGAPTVAVFGALSDPGAAEWRSLAIAGGGATNGEARPG
jgi:D-alanyl-D-alanine carboxypeptidase